MMGLRAIVVLLLLALGLGAVLWFTDERPPTSTVESTAVLEGRSLRDATRIRWEWNDRSAVEVGRGPDGRFQLQEPIVDVASAGYLKQIVDTWDRAQMKRVYDDTEANRTKAGVVPPELVMLVTFPDQPPLRIEVGAPGPLGDSRFLRVHGAIWECSIGVALLESMRVGLDDLRERAVWRNAFAHATEVVVDQRLASGKRETLHLKLEGDAWQLLAPVKGRADPVAAQAFVTAVLSLRADHFPSGLIRFPEREPEFVVRVRGVHGEEETRLWQEQGQLFGLLPGRGTIGFTSDNQQLVSIFENAASTLRARILVPMGDASFAEVVELAVDTGQERLRLRRESQTSEWRVVEPVDVPAAPTACNDAAYALQQLVAREFVEDADAVRPRAEDPRYGLGPGKRLVVTVRSAQDREGTILWFGNEVKRGDDVLVHTCRRDEPDTVALVAKDKVDVLRRPWLDYCALRVLRLGAMPEQVVLQRGNGPTRVFKIENDTWVLVGGGARGEVGGFVKDDLRDLVGDRAVDARGAAFAEPDWTLQLLRGNGDRLTELRVWDRAPDQPLIVQNRLAGDGAERPPLAFELSALHSKLLRELWQ